MATSQNGFTAGDRSHIHNPAVPGTNIRFPGGLRKGPTGDLLLWVALQLHHRVENGGTGYGMWGYAYRAIRGATSLSNHASGTAIDWHAPRHPLGKAGTFNAAQVREIRKILAEAGGCIRWGGDYTGRKDEMHFEVVASEAACARALAAVTPGAAPPPATTHPVAPVKKVKPVIISEPLRHGKNYVRLPGMVGTASGLYGRAWLSVSAMGGGYVTALYQKNTPRDGAPDGVAGERWDNARLRNGSRVYKPVPSGTEFIELWVDVLGGDPQDPNGSCGFAVVEFEPK